jgi:hypothetical protein
VEFNFMEIRTLVSFEAAGFPDESQWSENGSPLVPDGYSIAATIISALRSVGLYVSDPRQHQFYGWAFEIDYNNETEWCLLQCPGPWLLLVRQKHSVLKRLCSFMGAVNLKTVLKEIDRILKQEGRFSSIQWFTEQMYDSGMQNGEDVPLLM